MTENPLENQTELNQPEREPEEQKPEPALTQKPADPPTVYRWSYGDQRAFEQGSEKKKKHRGALVYAVVMSVAFLLCLAVLIGVLAFRDGGIFKPYPGQTMTTAEIAKAVKPGTVLIYAANSTSSGYATGFFVRSDGYIVTNYHAVAGMTSVTVTLYSSGEKKSAEIVGYHAETDLAVLKIEGIGYPALTIGNSDALEVGDVAVAIGNPAGESCAWSTTQGIISAVERRVTLSGTTSFDEITMIQTDAPVNPGNSGGPLCNGKGEVVGIVARKMTNYEGLGLAIPINGAMEIVEAIIRTGDASGVQSSISRVRPALGIMGGTVSVGDSFTYMNQPYVAQNNGVLVTEVSSTGASNGILHVADIIVKMDGKTVENMDVMLEMLYGYQAGDRVTLEIDRLGTVMTVEVVLGAS